MSTSSGLSKSPHDLHIEITEDTAGSLKVRPSSVASSHGDDDFIDSRSGTFDHRPNSLEEIVNGTRNGAFDESADHSESSDDAENDYDYVVIDFLNDSKAKTKTKTQSYGRDGRDVSGPVLILRRQNSRHFSHEATVTTSMIVFLTKKRRAHSDVPNDVDVWRRYCNFIVFYAWREPRIIVHRTIWWYYICPYSVIIVFVHPSRAIQIIEYEREHRTKPIEPEESYRIYIDRNDSRESLLDDDINEEFNRSYPVSDDGYQISFIDEEENVEVRKLTLSADFSRSYESKDGNLLSVDYGERCDTSSDYSLDLLDENEEDNHSTNMERSFEYSIEFREENVNKPKKRRKKSPKKNPKIKTHSVSTEDIDLEFHSANDENKERPQKGFELLFTNEADPRLKSRLTLSADFSKSHEELLSNEDVDEKDEQPVQREDYYIVQMYMEQNGKPGDEKTSTPRKGFLRKPKRDEAIEQELEYEVRPVEQQQQESMPEPLFVDDNVPEMIRDAEPKPMDDDGTISPKRITVFDEREQDQGPSTEPAEGGVMKRMSKENVFSFQKEFLKILRVPSFKKQEGKVGPRENEVPIIDKRVEESSRDYSVKREELDQVDMSHPPEERETMNENEATEPDEDDQPQDNDTLPNNVDTEEELTKRLTRVYRKKNLNTKKDDNANELRDILGNHQPEQKYQVFTVAEERVQKPKTKSLSDTFKGLFGRPSKNLNIAEPLDKREPEDDNNEISAIILEPVKDVDEDDSPVCQNSDVEKSLETLVIVEEDEVVEDTEVRHVESEIDFENFISEEDEDENPCLDKEQASIPEEQPPAPSGIAEDSVEPDEVTEKVDVKPASKKGPTLLSLVLGRKVNEHGDENDLIFPGETSEDLEPDETTEVPVRVTQVYRRTHDEPVTDRDDLAGLFEDSAPNEYDIQQVKEEEPSRARSISGKVKSGLRRIFSGPEKQPVEQVQLENDEEVAGHHLGPIQLSTVNENIDREQEDIQPAEMQWKDRSEENLVDETVDCIAVESNPPFEFMLCNSEDETKEEIGPYETGQSDEDTVEEEDRRVVKVYREKPSDDGKSINDEFICTNDETPCTDEDLPHTTNKTLPQKFALGFKRIFSGPKERSNIEPDAETATKDGDIEVENVGEVDEQDTEFQYEIKNEGEISPGDTVQDSDDAQIEPTSSEEPTFQTLCTEVVPKRVVYRQTTFPTENEDEQDMAELKDSKPISPFTFEIVKEETVPPKYDRSLSGRIKGSIRKIFRSKEDLTDPEEHEEGKDVEEISDIQPLRLEPIDAANSEDEHDDRPVQFEAIHIEVSLNTVPIDEDIIAEEVDTGVVKTADLDFSPFEPPDKETSDSETSEEGESDKLTTKDVEEPVTFETVPKRVIYRETALPKENDEEQEIAELKESEPLTPFLVEIVKEETVPLKYERSLSGRIKGSISKIFRSKENLTSPDEYQEQEDEGVVADIKPLRLEPINFGDTETEIEPDPKEDMPMNVIIKLTQIDEDVIAEEVDTGVVETADIDTILFEPYDKESSENSESEEESDKIAIKDEEPVTFETFSTEVVPKRVVYRETKLLKKDEEEQELDELKNSVPNMPFNIEVLTEETVPPKYNSSLPGRIKGSIRKIFGSKENFTSPEETAEEGIEGEISDIQPVCLEPIDIGDSESDSQKDPMELKQINVTIKLCEIHEALAVEEVDTGVVETVDMDISQFEPSDLESSDSENSQEEESDKVAVKDELPVKFETFSTEYVPKRVVYRQTTLPKANVEENELEKLKDYEPVAPYTVENVTEETVPPKYERSLSGRIKGNIRKLFRSKEDLTSPEVHQEYEEDKEISGIQPLCLEPVDIGESEPDEEMVETGATQINITIKPSEIYEDIVVEEIDTGVVETVDIDMDQFESSSSESSESEEESEKVAIKDEEPVTFESFSTEVVPKRVVYRQMTFPKENEEEQELNEMRASEPVAPYTSESVAEETVQPRYERSLSGRIKGSIRKIFRSKEDLTSPEEHEEHEDEEETSGIQPLCLEPVNIGDSESDGEIDPIESTRIDVTIKLSEVEEDVIAEDVDTGVVETFDIDMSQFQPSDHETSENEEEGDKLAIKDEEPVTFETFSTEVVPKRVVYRQTTVPEENQEEQELDEMRASEPDAAYTIESVAEETVPPKYDRSLSGRIKGRLRKMFRSKEDLTSPEEHPEHEDEEEVSSIQPLCLEPVNIGDSESDGEIEPIKSTRIDVTIKLSEADEDVISEEVDTGVVETVDVDMSQFEPFDNETSENEEESGKIATKGEEPVEFETFSTEVVPKRVVYRQTTFPKENEEEQELDEMRASEPVAPYTIENVEEATVPLRNERSLSGRIKGSFRKIFRSKEDLALPEEPFDEGTEDKVSHIQPLCLEPVDMGENESEDEPVETGASQINVTIKLSEIDEDIVVEEIDTGIVETVDIDMDQFESSSSESSENEEESEKVAIKDEEPVTFETFSTEVVPKRVVYRQTTFPKENEEEQELDEMRVSEPVAPYTIESVAEETVQPRYERSLSGRIKGSIRKMFRSKEDLTSPEEHPEHEGEEEMSSIQPLCLEPVNIGDSESDGEIDPIESTQINVTIKLSEADEDVISEEVDTGVVETVDIDMSQFEPSDNETSENEKENGKITIKGEEPVKFETFSTEVVPKRVVYRQTTFPKENEEEQELDEMRVSEPVAPYTIESVAEETVQPRYERSLSGRIKGSIRKIFRSKEDLTSPEEHEEHEDEEEMSGIQPLCLEPVNIGDSESDGEIDSTESIQMNVTIKLSEADEDVISEEVDTGVVETVDIDMSQFEPSDKETSANEEESDKVAIKDEEPVTFETFSTEVVPKRVVYRQTTFPDEKEVEQELDEMRANEPDAPYTIESVAEETVPPKYERSLSGRIKGRLRKMFRSKEDLTSPEEHPEHEDEEEMSSIQPLCLEPVNVGDSESDGEIDPIESTQIKITIKLSEADEDVIAEEVDTGFVETVDIDMSQFEPSDNETSENEEESDKLAIKDEEPVTFEAFSSEVVPKRVVYRQTTFPKENEEEQELDEMRTSELDAPYTIESVSEETVPPKYEESLPGRIKGSIRKIFRSKEDLTSPEEHPEHEDEEEMSGIQPLSLEPVIVGENESDDEINPTESTQINVTIKLSEIDEDLIAEEVDTRVVETIDIDMSQCDPSDSEAIADDETSEEVEGNKLPVKDEVPVTFETFSTEVGPKRVIYRQTTFPRENEDEEELDEMRASEPDAPYTVENVAEETVPPKYERSLSGRIKGRIRKIFRSKEDLTPPEEHGEHEHEAEVSAILPLCLEPIDTGDTESEGEQEPTVLAQINVTIKLSEIDEDVVAEEVDTGEVKTIDIDMSQFDPSDSEAVADDETSEEVEGNKLPVKNEEPVPLETFSAEFVPRRAVYRQTILPTANEEQQDLDELKESQLVAPYTVESVAEETVPPKHEKSLSTIIKGSIRKIFQSKEDLTGPDEDHECADQDEISDIQPLCLEPISIEDSESDKDSLPTDTIQVNVTLHTIPTDEDFVVEEVDTGVVETANIDIDMSQFESSESGTSDAEATEEEESDKLAIKEEDPVTFETFSAEVVPKRVVYRQTTLPKESEEKQELDEIKRSEPTTSFNIEVLPEETVPPKYERSLSGRIKGGIRKIFRSKENLTTPEGNHECADEENVSDIQPLSLEPFTVGDSESDQDPQLIDTAEVNITIKDAPIDEDLIVEEVDTGVVETADTDMNQFAVLESESSDAETTEEGESDKLATKEEEPISFETFCTEVIPKRVVYRETKLNKNEEDEDLGELKQDEPRMPFSIEVLGEEDVPPKYERSLSGRIKVSIKKMFQSKEHVTAPEELSEHETEEEISDIQPLCLEPIDFTHNEELSDEETGPFEPVEVNVAISPVPFDDDIIPEEVETGIVETVEFDFDQISDDKPEDDAIATNLHLDTSDDSSSKSSDDEEEPTQNLETAPVHDTSDDQEPELPEAHEIPVEEERKVTTVYRITDKGHDNDDLKNLMNSHPSEPVIHKPNKEQLSKPVGRFHPKRMRSSIIGFFDKSPKTDKRDESDSPELETESFEVKPMCFEPIDIDGVSDEPEEDEIAPSAIIYNHDVLVSDEEPITEVQGVFPPENEIDFDVIFESDESSDDTDSQEGNRPEFDQKFVLEVKEEDVGPEAAPYVPEIEEDRLEQEDELEEPEVTYEVESVPMNILEESVEKHPEKEEEPKYVIEVLPTKPNDAGEARVPEIVIDLAEDEADNTSSSADSGSEKQEDEEVKNEINESEEPRYFIEYSVAGVETETSSESDQSEKDKESDLEDGIADVLPVPKEEEPDDGASSSSSESDHSEKALEEESEDIAAVVLSAAQEDLHDDVLPSSSESEHSEKQEETDLHILAAPISEEDVQNDTASSSSEHSQHDDITTGDFDEPPKHELETPPTEEPVKIEVDIISFEVPHVAEIKDHSIETNEDKEICSSVQSDDDDVDQVPVIEEKSLLQIADNDIVESAVLCADIPEDDGTSSESSESVKEIEERRPTSVEQIEFELVESSYSVNRENVIIEEDKQTPEGPETINEALLAAVEASPVEEADVLVVETVTPDHVEDQISPAEAEDTEVQNLSVDEEDSHSDPGKCSFDNSYSVLLLSKLCISQLISL